MEAIQANKANANWFLAKLNGAKIVLADDTQDRLGHLNRAGFFPKFMKTEFKPDKLFECNLAPNALVKCASESMARDVASQLIKNGAKYDVVIGFYTVAVMDGKIIPKPCSRGEALSILKKLSGHTHSIITGVTLLHTSQNYETFEVETKVNIGIVSAEMLNNYVELGFWVNHLAGYDASQESSALIQSINGCFLNIMGTPFSKVVAGVTKILQDNESEPSSHSNEEKCAEKYLNATTQTNPVVPAKEELFVSSEEHDVTKQQVNSTVPSSTIPQHTGTYGGQFHPTPNNDKFSNAGNYGQGGTPTSATSQHTGTYVAQSKFQPTHNNDTSSNVGNYGRGGTSIRGFTLPANSCAPTSTRGQSNQLPSNQNGGFSNRGSFGHGGAGTPGFSGSRVDSFAESAVPSGEHIIAGQQPTQNDGVLSFLNRGGTNRGNIGNRGAQRFQSNEFTPRPNYNPRANLNPRQNYVPYVPTPGVTLRARTAPTRFQTMAPEERPVRANRGSRGARGRFAPNYGRR